MNKQEEQFILMAVLKYGSAWDAYKHYMTVVGKFDETCLLRDYLKMEDEAVD